MPTKKHSYELENFLVLAETTRDGVLVNQGGRHVFANQSLIRMLGYTSVGQILGTKIDFVLHPSIMEKVKTRFAQRLSGEPVPSQYETVFKKIDGSPLPVELNATLTSWNGKRAGMVSVRDISERKALESELENSRLQLQALLDDRTYQLQQKDREAQDLLAAMPDLMFIFDKSGAILNHQAPRELKLSLPFTGFSGNHIKDILPGKFADRGLRLVTQVLETKRMQFLDYQLPNTKGEVHDFEARFTPYGCNQVIVLIRDISERKRTEQRLVESRYQMKTILDSLTQVIWAVRLPDYEPLFCSQSFQAIYGREISEWEQDGRIWEKVIHPDDTEVIRKINNELASQRYTSNEYRILRPDGSVVWVLNQIRQVEELSGGQALIGSLKDITNRKSSELELVEASRKAEAASRAKTEFLSRMSHELRTPMNAILGFGQLLDMDKDYLNAEHQDAIQHILDGGQHLLGLINEVLEISKVDAGRIELKLETVSITDLCHRAIDLLRNLALKRNIEINVGFSHDQLLVRADTKRLTQILVNLLSNAIKYNHTGGTIHIYSEVASKQDSKRLRVQVKDSGIGIADDDRDKIFEPFTRLNTRNISDVEGTGIGLSITKKFVELMDGKIGFESEPGKGSTFWFDLPLVSTEYKANMALQPKKILYIEDNPVNCQLVIKMIAGHSDYHLDVAGDAESGIQKALQVIPDLILMDIGLPGMNGFEALKILRSDSKTAQIPVLAISAHAMQDIIDDGYSAGFQEYLTKPINVKQLLASIKQYLNTESSVL